MPLMHSVKVSSLRVTSQEASLRLLTVTYVTPCDCLAPNVQNQLFALP